MFGSDSWLHQDVEEGEYDEPDDVRRVPIAGECFQACVILGRISSGQMAGQNPENPQNSPGGMHQMIEGQVVVNREENPGLAIDAMT